jgi:DNA-directed RNA polymerase subunit RPC12/RpoP
MPDLSYNDALSHRLDDVCVPLTNALEEMIEAVQETIGALERFQVVSTTYTCDECGGTFKRDWSDEEALEESRILFGDIPEEERAIVCDMCYKRIMDVLGAQDAD